MHAAEVICHMHAAEVFAMHATEVFAMGASEKCLSKHSQLFKYCLDGLVVRAVNWWASMTPPTHTCTRRVDLVARTVNCWASSSDRLSSSRMSKGTMTDPRASSPT
eukprot:scaffold104119_cov21-Tisochrysis_lutea.AAC.1